MAYPIRVGHGLPYTGSVGATAPTYSMANFFKMTFARGSIGNYIKLLLIIYCNY